MVNISTIYDIDMNFRYILKKYSKTGSIISTIVLFSICAYASMNNKAYETEHIVSGQSLTTHT